MISERIKSARRMSGLSQRALAAKIGVSAMAISKYERGIITPGSCRLIAISKALGRSVEYFLRPVTVRVLEPEYIEGCPNRKWLKSKDAT